ncbi:MAG: hypothetical protein COV01_02460 [Candidatus Taylorbacteria bacterium CG10_big_fil_rev_8_21_14_0_10_41_48]|uniref:Ada DNA repair metal-binding domain-containing protein n=1 Tax=Candidatus Taylorbacteria bacterium CG10_big_fil_rev_8_21_14_0_10_41_48 TaxID=1975024 RepID=A0A2M8LCK4_9BACT|nr:MAG: hypothetical protein COV01_02460 [Candidatus Taylorbacteria bacterium CG10_big_fil_rev_8_21_14_0_10_41_48]
MILTDLKGKIKRYIGLLDRKDVYMTIIIALTAISAYILGRLSVLDTSSTSVTIENKAGVFSINQTTESTIKSTATVSDTSKNQGVYVASKSSTKYHLPTCSGAQRIAEANKIWFTSKVEAEKAGYTPAANCPGI